MATLQSSFTSLSLSSNSFLGKRFSIPLCPPQVISIEKPGSILAKKGRKENGKNLLWHKAVDTQNLQAFTILIPDLKQWERKECKPNSLPKLHKMHVKVGDTVKVISGRDKGKIGEVTDVIKHNSTILVKDINLKTKHVKSREEDEAGQIIKIEAPIHSSNVMLYSKEQNVASRVGHKTLDNGQRVRYLIKTGEIIDSAENWKKVIKEREKKKEAVAAAS